MPKVKKCCQLKWHLINNYSEFGFGMKMGHRSDDQHAGDWTWTWMLTGWRNTREYGGNDEALMGFQQRVNTKGPLRRRVRDRTNRLSSQSFQIILLPSSPASNHFHSSNVKFEELLCNFEVIASFKIIHCQYSILKNPPEKRPVLILFSKKQTHSWLVVHNVLVHILPEGTGQVSRFGINPEFARTMRQHRAVLIFQADNAWRLLCGRQGWQRQRPSSPK